jgi:hypothetical protein
MRNALSVVLVVVLCLLVAAPMANAGTRNLRPLAPADFSPAPLQTAFDGITLSGPGIDPSADQTPFSLFTSDAVGGAVATFIIELASFSDTNEFGLYSRGDTANKALIFDGSADPADMAFIQFTAGGDIYVNFSLAASGFGRDFGFYVDVYEAAAGGGGDSDPTTYDYTVFSEDSENVGEVAQSLIYQGDDETLIQIGGWMPGLFTDNQFIVAFEDLRVDLGVSDEDYSDLVVMVESITPIPAPAAVLLGVLGLPMVGWVKRRLA